VKGRRKEERANILLLQSKRKKKKTHIEGEGGKAAQGIEESKSVSKGREPVQKEKKERENQERQFKC